MNDHELANLQSKIKMLAALYAILFGASLVIIVVQYSSKGFGGPLTVFWAVTLGGAVATRLYRTSLVNKYNAAISGGAPPPLT